jgi:hypothetical protein
MDGPAWTAYQAVSLSVEAALATSAVTADALRRYLDEPGRPLDVSKGEGAWFDEERQLVQDVVVARIDPKASARPGLAHQLTLATYVDLVNPRGVGAPRM